MTKEVMRETGGSHLEEEEEIPALRQRRQGKPHRRQERRGQTKKRAGSL